jgi:hypothetical protein
MRQARHLVVLRAGDSSLHTDWVGGRGRDFDLFISYYGDKPDRYRRDADLYEHRPGPKWPCIAQLLAAHPTLVEQYDSFWFPDDDLASDTDNLNCMFAFFCAHRLHIAQPALTRDSYYTWSTLLQDTQCYLRLTGFVEVMAPIFSRSALKACMHTFAESPSGWGLDWAWPGLCRGAGLDRFAVIDATPVHHTRPVGGELYRNHREINPREDAERVIRHYGLREVRAFAKYSLRGRIKDVPVPWAERLLLSLKRLNGRRKHLVPK